MSLWLERNPIARKVVRLHIYGSDMDSRAQEAVSKLNLVDIIISHGRLERDPITKESGRTQVVREMQKCDLLLLLHGNDPSCAEYIPSKLYEYLWARRPILALTHQNPQLDELIQRFGGLISNNIDPQAIAHMIDIVWSKWSSRSLEPNLIAPIGVDTAVSEILKKVDGLGSE